MVEYKLRIPDGALANLRRQLEIKLARIVARVTSEIYNYILENDYPYWSGQYVASWNANIGTKSYTYLASVGHANTGKGAATNYPRPTKVSLIPSSNPYEKGYITNAAPHAYQVEEIGTPTHLEGGWHIASHARNNIVGRYRYF